MNIVQKFFALFLLAVAGLYSCNDDDNSINLVPSAGAWKVFYFFDKQDQTGNYTSYTFEFGASGSLVATGSGQTYSGTWSTGIDDSTDKFLIDFNGSVPGALSELEEDWRIVVMRNDFMHFEHTSGGNGDTDVLKFSK